VNRSLVKRPDQSNLFTIIVCTRSILGGRHSVPTGPTNLDTVWTATGRRKSYGIWELREAFKHNYNPIQLQIVISRWRSHLHWLNKHRHASFQFGTVRNRNHGSAEFILDLHQSTLIYSRSTLIYNRSTLIYSRSTLIYNRSTLIYSRFTLLYNRSILIYINRSTSIYKRFTLIHIRSTLIYNWFTLIYTRSTLIYNRSTLIFDWFALIYN
jgi:hypothetical protein